MVLAVTGLNAQTIEYPVDINYTEAELQIKIKRVSKETDPDPNF